ncbi:MAG TPA: dsRBD fold-containing protein [Actinotalea sp.]|nr:dsRBD fold-containing protein [Actinotalea sp.]
MRASVGDRLVLASSVVDGTVRDGRVVELRHDDGSPPYLVEWLDTGERSLVFPGPDAHVEHAVDVPAGAPTPARTWRVQVTLSHEGPETTAQAVLVAGTPEHLGAVGRARRNPEDGEVPVIGDEVAVARALRRLADRLTDTAEDQIEDSTGRPARVHG